MATVDSYEPCVDNYATNYMNRLDVKDALHVQSDIVWAECSDPVYYNYNFTDAAAVSTAPIYKYLIDGGFGLNILIYSGDDDSVCPTIGDHFCMILKFPTY